jgi:23S rRNA (cytidine1920-2'-O)/16S rRNA (cytidine1409-2'-O)-methyltransferase
MKPAKVRLDQLLADRGLAGSREKAKAMILAGTVLVNGQKAEKAGHAVAADAQVEVLEPLRYASRGGLKLEAGLLGFDIDVKGKVCVDIGASTGGFTDCLLQHGAAKVYAVDVGSGQLDWKLRNDPRVVVKEGINARKLEPSEIGEPADLAVCDASFISATLLVPAMARLLKPDGRMVVLVKPQFEAGKGQVGKGGIVRDPDLHAAACRKVAEAVRGLGFAAAVIESPISGAEGNKEFLLYAHH